MIREVEKGVFEQDIEGSAEICPKEESIVGAKTQRHDHIGVQQAGSEEAVMQEEEEWGWSWLLMADWRIQMLGSRLWIPSCKCLETL